MRGTRRLVDRIGSVEVSTKVSVDAAAVGIDVVVRITVAAGVYVVVVDTAQVVPL